MLFVKFIRYSCVLATLLSSSVVVLAQDAPPKREDVPFLPTNDQAVRAMLKLADVKKTDVVYDLGCGDGRIVIEAARLYGARGVGVDVSPGLIARATETAKRAGVENLVRFEVKDLFETDIHEATVVTLFLLPALNLKLRPKLQHDLKPGSRVVSNTWDMGDWKPEKEITVTDEQPTENAGRQTAVGHRLMLWTIQPRK